MHDYEDSYGGSPYEQPSQPTPSPAPANVPEPTESDPPPSQPEPEIVPVTSFAEVQPLFATHCAMCHPATPPDWQDYAAAKAYADNGRLYEKIWTLYQADDPLAMPLGNATGMTEEERQQIIDWINEGGAE